MFVVFMDCYVCFFLGEITIAILYFLLKCTSPRSFLSATYAGERPLDMNRCGAQKRSVMSVESTGTSALCARSLFAMRVAVRATWQSSVM
jgi:hypothetical protein